MEADVYIAEVLGFGFGAWPTVAAHTVHEYGVRTLNDLLLDRMPAGKTPGENAFSCYAVRKLPYMKQGSLDHQWGTMSLAAAALAESTDPVRGEGVGCAQANGGITQFGGMWKFITTRAG